MPIAMPMRIRRTIALGDQMKSWIGRVEKENCKRARRKHEKASSLEASDT